MGLIAQAPPDWFDAERGLAFSAGIVARRLVRFCAPVADKMATQTIGAALAFKAGDTVEMALQDGVHSGDRPEVRPAADQPAPGGLMRRARPGQLAG